MAIKMPAQTQQVSKKANPDNPTRYKPIPKNYTFRDNHVEKIFHLLDKGGKLKLPDPLRPDEVGRTSDPNYCLFHKMVHRPTAKYFAFIHRIQPLLNVGVLYLKSKPKKSATKMVTVKFRYLAETTVQDGVLPIPSGEMMVTDQSFEDRSTKGFPDNAEIWGDHVGPPRHRHR